ncbi:MAG: ParA family protein [Spirochaetales bacterium]|nr:ParA family protein [Exilispira sp.]NMC68161.1 ParA family protein [Spirochaetales bacterium]
MGKIITISNQKGGVGKTTTIINLGYALSLLEKKVLIIDLDPQGNATSGIGVRLNDSQPTIYEIMMTNLDIKSALIKRNNIDLIPANIHLSGATIELINEPNREYKLAKALDKIKDDYDYIFIDTPPSLGLLTINALAASDEVIIPVQCEFFALEGLSQLLKTIKKVQSSINNKLVLNGVILTMYDIRTNLSKEVYEEVKKYFEQKLYKTVIPRNVSIAESSSHGISVIEYEPKSSGAISYMNLAKEFLQQVSIEV